MDSENASMKLEEAPFLPIQRPRSMTGRNPRYPFRFLILRLNQLLQDSIWRDSLVVRRVPSLFELFLEILISALRFSPLKAQAVAPLPSA